jgi:hypothetical protein
MGRLPRRRLLDPDQLFRLTAEAARQAYAAASRL